MGVDGYDFSDLECSSILDVEKLLTFKLVPWSDDWVSLLKCISLVQAAVKDYLDIIIYKWFR